LSLGHRRILFVAGSARSVAVEDRRAGFSESLSRAGLPAEPWGRIEITYSGGDYRPLVQLMGDTPEWERPTAIFAWSDDVAMGAIEALRRECGLSVPGDVSVIGFDGTEASGSGGVRLTSVRQPIAEIAGRAVNRLVAQVRGEMPSETAQLFAPALLERETCAPPRVLNAP